MSLKLQGALHNNAIVEIIEEESQKMYGNLVIPDAGKEHSKIGRIINIGPGYWTALGERIPTELEVDTIVVLPNFGGQNFRLNGKDYIIIKEQDILATLKEEK